MRKPRDFDSELKALADKAKQLKERRVRDLGALVTALNRIAEAEAGALLRSFFRKRRLVQGEGADGTGTGQSGQ